MHMYTHTHTPKDPISADCPAPQRSLRQGKLDCLIRPTKDCWGPLAFSNLRFGFTASLPLPLEYMRRVFRRGAPEAWMSLKEALLKRLTSAWFLDPMAAVMTTRKPKVCNVMAFWALL